MANTKKVNDNKKIDEIIDLKKESTKKNAKEQIVKTGKVKSTGKVLTEEQLEEKEIQTILLSDLLTFLKEYKEEKRTKSNFDALMKCIKVKSYMPLIEKASIMLDICIDLRYSFDKMPEIKTIELELKSIFIVLLSYTNIEYKKEELEFLMDFENYDLLMETGVVDEIKKVCEKDYNKLMELIIQMFNFESVGQVFNALGNFDTETMLQGIKEGAKFIKELPEYKLKDLSAIAGMSDPLIKQISEIVNQ